MSFFKSILELSVPSQFTTGFRNEQESRFQRILQHWRRPGPLPPPFAAKTVLPVASQLPASSSSVSLPHSGLHFESLELHPSLIPPVSLLTLASDLRRPKVQQATVIYGLSPNFPSHLRPKCTFCKAIFPPQFCSVFVSRLLFLFLLPPLQSSFALYSFLFPIVKGKVRKEEKGRETRCRGKSTDRASPKPSLFFFFAWGYFVLCCCGCGCV